ncbi:MAG TPA: XTP/dITP diphosphatase [Smithellaceae bacterium]|nr:XTP/dITP diphosphatase [Smithellaceae bacterium]HRV44921.1 XTP/dITP diphosphatase [Smithellaceae bacterium]
MKIVLATKNEGKVREIAQIMKGTGIELVSLNHFEALPEIVEDGATYLENALKKARTVSEYLGETVLADDSGLRVDALKGEPGVYSARYAGENATDEENNAKLLGKLKEVPTEKRTASFFCALVLYRPEGIYHSFEAEWRGRIIDEGRGTNGFGYDPIFLDPRLGKTAAELPPEIKNRVSHRGQAFAKFKAWLEAGRLE